MRASFHHGLLTVVVACVAAGTVDAAQLSMRFADGGGQVTLAPSETAIIEIVWRTEAGGKTAYNLAGLSNRFDVEGPATIEAVSTSTPLSGWMTDLSGELGDPLDAFFASANAVTSLGNFLTETDVATETVVQQIEIRNVDGASGTVEIAFRIEEPMPDAFTSDAATWTLVGADPGALQYDIGQGSPGYSGIGGENPRDPLVVQLGTDGGGLPDTDGDGVPDDEDAFPNDGDETTDTDDDGVGDNADEDDDNDGVIDEEDAFPDDPSEDTDTDDDGTGDRADQDDDNDGVPDAQDADPLDPDVGRPSTGGGGSARSGPCGMGMISFVSLSLIGLLLMQIQRRR